MNQESEEIFLTFKKALAVFAGSESTLRRRIEDGSLPIRQLGGKGYQIEISASALKEANKRRRPSPATPNGLKKKRTNDEKLPGPKPKWRK